jgi:NHL repeat
MSASCPNRRNRDDFRVGVALHNVAVDRQGNIYTAEVNTGQVQKFRRIDAQSR